MPSMKIRRLHFVDHQQFRDTVLDFTHPETGDALDRVCLIGRNGTGKTTALRHLEFFLRRVGHAGTLVNHSGAVEFEYDGLRFTALSAPEGRTMLKGDHARIDVSALVRTPPGEFGALTSASGVVPPVSDVLSAAVPRLVAGDDLVVWSRAEAAHDLGVRLDVPKTNINEALALGRDFPLRHDVSNAHIAEMWKLLVYLVKQRDADRQAFENRPESLQKTKAQLIEEFDAAHPFVLDELAELWDQVLEPAGLMFDVERARIPIQLTDNLEAFVVRRTDKRQIRYGELSTGTRNFLFRVGHLFLIFFRSTYERAFVLIDEPEDCLFPDFLFDVMGIYERIVGPGTQMFVATHNPIVAAQFEPYERIVLDWDDHGGVKASRGVCPKGDDPNELLRLDFGLPELMGPEGRALSRGAPLRDSAGARARPRPLGRMARE